MGGGAKMQCLRQHESELSPECKARMAEGREQAGEKVEAIQAACKDDAAKHCPGIEPGGGAVARCLLQHKSELTPGCQEALPKRQP
jgi:hypothetical protein